MLKRILIGVDDLLLVLRWDVHREWTSRCMEEFFKQGDMEKEAGLDFTPLCDRKYATCNLPLHSLFS